MDFSGTRAASSQPFEVRVANAIKLKMKVTLLCNTPQEVQALRAVAEHMSAPPRVKVDLCDEAKRTMSPQQQT